MFTINRDNLKLGLFGHFKVLFTALPSVFALAGLHQNFELRSMPGQIFHYRHNGADYWTTEIALDGMYKDPPTVTCSHASLLAVTLFWADQIEDIIAKIYQRMGVLKRINALLTLYNSLIFPLLD